MVALRLAFSTVDDALRIAPDGESVDQLKVRLREAIDVARAPHCHCAVVPLAPQVSVPRDIREKALSALSAMLRVPRDAA